MHKPLGFCTETVKADVSHLHQREVFFILPVKFGIIGAGVVGTTLAVLLNEAGCELIGVYTRSERSYERFCSYLPTSHLNLDRLAETADILFITTNDNSIEKLAVKLTEERKSKSGQIWIHCSGSLRSEIMCKDLSLQVSYLSLHPLQTFANIDSALVLMPGTHFGLEGDSRETEEVGEELVKILGGIPHKIDPCQKNLYHAGAVAASNYLVSLVYLAVKLFKQAGIEKQDALQSLLPLIAGSYHNLEKVGLPDALTGPIARGDIEVVRKHLQEIPLELKDIYQGLGRLALEMGIQRKNLSGGSYSKEVLIELQSLLGMNPTKEMMTDEDN